MVLHSRSSNIVTIIAICKRNKYNPLAHLLLPGIIRELERSRPFAFNSRMVYLQAAPWNRSVADECCKHTASFNGDGKTRFH